ncbi:MAG: flagellar hook-basal body complex protein FliE [Syntrophobacteraceae bacterium]
MRIDPIIRNLHESAPQVKKSSGGGMGGFADQLKAKISEVNQLQNQADAAMAEGAVNGASNVHETMIRLEEADMSLRLLGKIRNKALDAYHEMMRMQF